MSINDKFLENTKMSYRAKDGNRYSHKETPSEYRARKSGGSSGGYYEPSYPRIRYILGVLSSVIMGIAFLNSLSGNYQESFFLILLGLIIYRVSRWDAWERSWIILFVCIISFCSWLSFYIAAPLIGFILSLVTISVMVYDIKDITFVPSFYSL